MSDIFKAHINKFANVSDEEFEAILSYFHFKTISKKDNLLEAGQVCKSNFLVF
ncbi:hypothetical protein [Confluentibacter citreus]|uniref:hypothetical protein n=1 Tax=Confluentibacter citreus TaxID=2007307 RepID=UPI0012FE45C2|nr:hypothetical protein [Confluentibacter citreus]